MTKKPKPAGSSVEEIHEWWEENVGPFDPEPDGREWPRWMLELWLILREQYEQDAVRAAEGSRSGASTGGSKSSKTVPSLVRYVEAVVARSRKGETNDQLWNAIPEKGDLDSNVCRDGVKLFDDTSEGGGRSITRDTFDKYVTQARTKRKK